MEIRNIEEGGAAERRLSFLAFIVDMAENVVFGTGGSDGQIQVLVATATVQITPCRAVGYQEVNSVRENDLAFQVWRAGTEWSLMPSNSMPLFSRKVMPSGISLRAYSGCLSKTMS